MEAIDITLEEFLSAFFNKDEVVCLRVFDDQKNSTYKGAKLETSIENIGSMLDTLHEHNNKNRGIYFVVNSGGNLDSDITRINAQFMECDDLTFDEQLTQIETFPLEPSIIVKTRKSLHSYWLMKDADIKSFRRIQKSLIKHFSGDKACINESRVLRLPGFNHCKADPIMVECIKFNPELRYTQAELEAVLPQAEDEHVKLEARATKSLQKGLSLVQRKCEFVNYCRQEAKDLSEHDWYALITNLAVFEGGDALIHELSKPYPTYTKKETDRKIAHFLESGTNPINCITIAEKGFVCPKLEDGSCGCKSPAAVCYKPLDIEDLRFYLSRETVTRNTVDNMQTAEAFIKKYMNKFNSVIAGTFISYEMKDYFGLKTASMKPLVVYQKELYNNHKNLKQDDIKENLPAWYEDIGNGELKFFSGLLANHMAQNVNAFYSVEQYYSYQNGVYVAKSDLEAKKIVRSFMKPRYTSNYNIIDAEAQWRMQIVKPIEEINCNPFIINVKNGLYNVQDGSFNPHSPESYSTVQINATYDPTSKCPQFLEFLKGILPDAEINLVQEILGYLLIPINKAQKSFVLVGAPNAGKSTLLSIAQEILLGKNNVSNISWQSLSDRFKTAELFGKLANIFADLPSKGVDDNGIFKALTGEDFIVAERKNKNPFSFKNYARILFSCNDIPRNLGDKSGGFYRRLIIIRFNKSVPENKRDPNLREKLEVERDGILMWALEGLKRLIANDYVFSETDATRAELQKYRIESNSVLSFIDECCEIKADAEILRVTFYNNYMEYCYNSGLKPVSQANFNKEIESLDQTIQKGLESVSRRKIWKGIKTSNINF